MIMRTALRQGRGFTLVELMVVIGVIVILVGLTVGVIATVSRKSEVRQTEQTLQLLDMAHQEWELAAERQITYGTNGTPTGARYDVQEVPNLASTSYPHRLTRQVVSILSRNNAAKQILGNIHPDLIREGVALPDPAYADLRLTVFDPWDREVIVVFPGRLWLPSDPTLDRDVDGTIKTAVEKILGSCANRRICFVSAGPDGEFGSNASVASEAERTRAADNVYSYPLLKTEDAP